MQKSSCHCSVSETCILYTCNHCGYVRESKSKIIDVPAEMHELKASSAREDKQEWWNMLQWYVKYSGWSSGRAAHTFRDKFGVWPRGLNNDARTPNKEIEKFIQQRLRAYIYGQKRKKF